MIYHFLPEAEHFSEFKGGAISRWAANVLRDDRDAHIVCSSADATWGFAPERIHLAPHIRKYLKFRARKFYPPQLSGRLLRYFYGSDLPLLQKDDVVWVHGVPALAEAVSTYAKRAGAKLVFHLHSAAFTEDSQLVLKRLKRDMDQVVFCSDFLNQKALQRFPDLSKTVILYNGADERLFVPPSSRHHSGPPTVLFASRLVAEKGVHVFVEAMRLLQQRGVELQAKVFGAAAFGESAETEYTRSLQRNVPANVLFFGYESGAKLAQEFRRADIFCLPSTYEEPFAMVLVEAMSSGLPVVASRVGGIPEVVTSDSGILVPPSDPEALASALRQLATSQDLRDRMGAAGNAIFSQRFTWSHIRERYQVLLTALKNS